MRARAISSTHQAVSLAFSRGPSSFRSLLGDVAFPPSRARLIFIPTHAVKSPSFSACWRGAACGYEQETLSRVLGFGWHHNALLQRCYKILQEAVVSSLPNPDDCVREVLVYRLPTVSLPLTVIDRSTNSVAGGLKSRLLGLRQ